MKASHLSAHLVFVFPVLITSCTELTDLKKSVGDREPVEMKRMSHAFQHVCTIPADITLNLNLTICVLQYYIFHKSFILKFIIFIIYFMSNWHIKYSIFWKNLARFPVLTLMFNIFCMSNLHFIFFHFLFFKIN